MSFICMTSIHVLSGTGRYKHIGFDLPWVQFKELRDISVFHPFAGEGEFEPRNFANEWYDITMSYSASNHVIKRLVLT
jgi:hypothetical protein